MSSPFNDIDFEETNESNPISICAIICDILENSETLDEEELFNLQLYHIFSDS